MASMAAATSEGSLLERRFRFAEHGTTLGRDTMAGLTTFIVMAYIIFLNPAILSATASGDKAHSSTASSRARAWSPA